MDEVDSVDEALDKESDDAATKTVGMDVIYTGIGQITKFDLEIAKNSNASIFIYDIPNPQKDALSFARDNRIPIVRFRNIVEMVKTLQGNRNINSIDVMGSNSSDHVVKRIS